MKKKLFEEQKTPHIRPMSYSNKHRDFDKYYEYARDSNTKSSILRRQFFEKLFEAYQDEEINASNEKINTLIQSFRNTRNKQLHLSVFYELFTFWLFYKLDCSIQAEKKMRTGRVIDFLMSKQNEEFYVEVTSLQKKENVPIHIIVDKINKNVKSLKYLIHVKDSLHGFCEEDVDKKVLKKIQKWIDNEKDQKDFIMSFDIRSYDDLEKKLNSGNMGERFQALCMKLKDSGWTLHLSKWKRDPEGIDSSDRIVAFSPSGTVVISPESLRNTIKEKNNKYGSLDKPYILVIFTVDYHKGMFEAVVAYIKEYKNISAILFIDSHNHIYSPINFYYVINTECRRKLENNVFDKFSDKYENSLCILDSKKITQIMEIPSLAQE